MEVKNYELYQLLKNDRNSLTSDQIKMLVDDFIKLASDKISINQGGKYIITFDKKERFNGVLVCNPAKKTIQIFDIEYDYNETMNITINDDNELIVVNGKTSMLVDKNQPCVSSTQKNSKNKKTLIAIIVVLLLMCVFVVAKTIENNKSTTNTNDYSYTDSINDSSIETTTVLPVSEYPKREDYLKVLEPKISEDTGLDDISLDPLGLTDEYDTYEINFNFSGDFKTELGRLYLMLDDNDCVIGLYAHCNRSSNSGGSEGINRMIAYNVAIDCAFVMAKQVDGYYGSTEEFLNNFTLDQQAPNFAKGHCNKSKDKCIAITESTSSTCDVYVAYGDEACNYVESIC